MGAEEAIEQDDMGAMNHRQIKLADGRYLVFYTFTKLSGSSGLPSSASTPQQEATHAKELNLLRAESSKEPYV